MNKPNTIAIRCRKKPLEVDAVYWAKDITYAMDSWPQWLIDALNTPREDTGSIELLGNGELSITTLEGTIIARLGDYVIRGIHGELYPCKSDIFIATYELV